MASSHAVRKRQRSKAAMASSKRQRSSHACAARSSVPKRAAEQRVSIYSDDDDEMGNESSGLEASDSDGLAADLASAARHALRQAEVEGLTLQASDNTAGFKGVNFISGKPKPYQAQVWRGGKLVHLGCFATAEEAALCYARDIAANGSPALTGVYAAAAAPAPLTAEEALQQAEAEGLTLLPADSMTGFKGVNFISGRHKPYKAQVWRGGKQVHLGTFATAEEAALSYARDVAINVALAPVGVAGANTAPGLTAEEALWQAEAEGLTLQPADNAAGFKGVYSDSGTRSKPYQANVWRDGKLVHLGSFATAEEAALCYSRDIVANGAPNLSTSKASKAAAVAPTAPEEAPWQAEGPSVQGMLSVPARPSLVADLCKIIERQSSEITKLRRDIAMATGHPLV